MGNTKMLLKLATNSKPQTQPLMGMAAIRAGMRLGWGTRQQGFFGCIVGDPRNCSAEAVFRGTQRHASHSRCQLG
jgi:hypothetical protein